jgi:hypothetical protein
MKFALVCSYSVAGVPNKALMCPLCLFSCSWLAIALSIDQLLNHITMLDTLIKESNDDIFY